MTFALDAPEKNPSLRDARRLFGEVDRAASRIRRRFIALVKQSRQRITTRQLENFLAEGNITEIFRIAEDLGPSLSTSVEDEFLIAAALAALAINLSTDRAIAFDAAAPFATAEMIEIRQIHAVRISAAQSNVFSDVLEDGFLRNLTNRQIAEELLGSVGLTVSGFAAVQRYRLLLEKGSLEALTRESRDKRFDRTVEAAAAGTIVLTGAQITRMSSRFRDNQIKLRAETIGLSSGNAAVHAGDEEMFRQAIGLGVFTAEDIDQEWLTRRDNAVRTSHRLMHGQGRPFGVPFRSGAGNLLRYPGDLRAPFRDRVRCRCGLRRIIK